MFRERTESATARAAANTGHVPALIAEVRALTGLDVESVQLGPQRSSIALTARPGVAPPDSEQTSLAAIADRLWQSGQLGVSSETLAFVVMRPLTGGAVERRTYFFYRSLRQERRQP